ncbi:Histone deacetylase complex subunit [Dimargaris cristalligena]|nr:Histone deacetylase complex subunit [Dimargaris cristalligena]
MAKGFKQCKSRSSVKADNKGIFQANGHRSRSYNADITRCVCGGDQEDGLFMIQCDSCKVWQHGECVNLPDQKYCPESYFCEVCRPEDHPYLILAEPAPVGTPKTGTALNGVGPVPTGPTGYANSNTNNNNIDDDDEYDEEEEYSLGTGKVISSSKPRRSNPTSHRSRSSVTATTTTNPSQRSPKGKAKALRPLVVPSEDSLTDATMAYTSLATPQTSSSTHFGAATGLIQPPTQGTWATPTSFSQCPSPSLPTESKRSYESDSDLYVSEHQARKRKVNRSDSAASTASTVDHPYQHPSPPGAEDPAVSHTSTPAPASPNPGLSTTPLPRKRLSSKKSAKSSTKKSSSSSKSRSSHASRRSGEEPASKVALSTQSDPGSAPARSATTDYSHDEGPPAPSSVTSDPAPFVCPVSYPSPKMTFHEMIKRTNYILDYISRVQVSLAEHKSPLPSSTRSSPINSGGDTFPASHPSAAMADPAPSPLDSSCSAILTPVSMGSSGSISSESNSQSLPSASSMQLIDMLTRDLIRFQEMYTTN